jgi:ATP-dependent Lhr-like helicase
MSQLVSGPVDPTRRAHARALVLLDRWGVVARDALAAEAIAGGFSAVYPVLRAMEEAGKIRRGHFVDGLGGAQFAFAGAVDQLRAARDRNVRRAVRSLHPIRRTHGARFSRGRPGVARERRDRATAAAAGAAVVLVDGERAASIAAGARC